ncbi:hypothetical protein WL99_22220 [Burkholderia cepacia]|nr:hypothetical protein WL99_22220 [Burkholderia cepacia]
MFTSDAVAVFPNAIVFVLVEAASLPSAMESAPVACAPFVVSPPIAMAFAPLARVALAAFPFPPKPIATAPFPVARDPMPIAVLPVPDAVV